MCPPPCFVAYPHFYAIETYVFWVCKASNDCSSGTCICVMNGGGASLRTEFGSVMLFSYMYILLTAFSMSYSVFSQNGSTYERCVHAPLTVTVVMHAFASSLKDNYPITFSTIVKSLLTSK